MTDVNLDSETARAKIKTGQLWKELQTNINGGKLCGCASFWSEATRGTGTMPPELWSRSKTLVECLGLLVTGVRGTFDRFLSGSHSAILFVRRNGY